MNAICETCPRHCALAEGQTGFCRARAARAGKVVAENYGRVTSLALDPIEKKPLARFYPGSKVLSVGSYGCNLRCPFCQNYEISQCGDDIPYTEIDPEELAARAAELAPRGNIGLAFTYNEPAVGWEYVRDASRAAKALGMKNVMVTSGCFSAEVMDVLLESVDAFNIDLKCFTEAGYGSLGGARRWRVERKARAGATTGGGLLETVKGSIAAAAKAAHVEVTTLVVPGLSDGEAEMEAEAAWLAGLSPDIPLHLSRYFPRWRAIGNATAPEVLHRLAAIARRHLNHVYLGNV